MPLWYLLGAAAWLLNVLSFPLQAGLPGWMTSHTMLQPGTSTIHITCPRDETTGHRGNQIWPTSLASREKGECGIANVPFLWGSSIFNLKYFSFPLNDVECGQNISVGEFQLKNPLTCFHVIKLVFFYLLCWEPQMSRIKGGFKQNSPAEGLYYKCCS